MRFRAPVQFRQVATLLILIVVVVAWIGVGLAVMAILGKAGVPGTWAYGIGLVVWLAPLFVRRSRGRTDRP